MNRSAIAAFAAALPALALVACGGSRDEAAAASPGAATRASAQAAGATAGKKVTPGDAYILAPHSRTLAPVAVYTTNGTVQNPTNVLSGQATLIQGAGSYITLDFGKEVGGIVSLQFSAASSAAESVGVAFTESNAFVGTASDGSNPGPSNTDGALTVPIASTGASTWTMPAASLRGGFRYITVFMRTGGWIHLSQVSLNFTASPAMADPGAYPNYFYSNDDLVNRLWYAGAYTVQTNTIAPTQGRQNVAPGWDNSAVISGGASVLSDGAKRDRMVWPGDLGISAPTAYVSTGDTASVRNALQRMYDSQTSAGELPFCGPPFNIYGSDTYHLWTLLGTHNYVQYSGDTAWLAGIWPRYKSAMTYIRAKINGAHGLLAVTNGNDWARGDQGGENIAANAMMYRALVTGATLAGLVNDSASAASYTSAAATLKTNINAALWDATRGAYRDNPGSTLYPQDGNSLAIWYGVVDSADKTPRIVADLAANLGTLGARAPEWSNNISPFAGSMQLMAMLSASDDTDALALMRREWGYMLQSPSGTGTFWEGYGADGGSGGYAPWYMSHAHGWSTGPTSALTFYTLGIQITGVKGQQYSVVPHPGDLTHVEGALTVDTGKVLKNSYDRGADGSFTMHVDSSTDSGSTGVIGVPKFGLPRKIKIDGKVAWNGSAFLGATGIASADQDERYVYFRGVAPASRKFAYTGNASGWTTCAAEAGRCVFDGVRGVRYGSGSSFVYASFNGGTDCANTVFGDPTPNVAKHCELSDGELPPTVGVWSTCADENATCAFSNTRTVAFGARATFAFQVLAGGAPCNVATFGDPLPGAAKRCYVGDLPRNASFESPALAAFAYNPANAVWTFTARNGDSGSGIAPNDSAFGASPAPEGTQVAFLQAGGSMTQALDDLPAGRYALGFRAARRGFGGQQAVSAYLDGTLLGTWSPASVLFDSFSTPPVALAAGHHTITFSGQNASGDNTAFVDDVSILRY